MNNIFIKFIYLIGTSVCHQLPDRSFSYAGNQNCVCSRCEGIYIGFFLSAILLLLMFRKKQAELPSLYIIIILILFIFSTIIDGVLSYLSIIDTNNFSRFITGYLAGSAAAVIIYPVFNYQYYLQSSDERIFTKFRQLIIFILINCVFIYLGMSDFKFINLIFFYISPFSVIFTFFAVNLLVTLLIPAFSRKADKLFSKFLIIPGFIASGLTVIEIFISYRLHIFLKNF